MKNFLASMLLVLTLTATAQTHDQELWIDNGNRHIYGELFTPENVAANGPVAIIAHGFNGSADYGRNYFGVMGKLGYRCYTFDFPCGSVRSRSDNNTLNMSVLDEVSDLKAIVRYFRQQGHEHVVLIGESQGGLVSALTAADLKEQVSQLVLIYPALCIPDNWRQHYPRVENIRDTTELWGVKMGRRYFEEIHDMRPLERIGQYRGPVLIVQGDADRVVSMDDSRRAQQIYRPGTHLHVIPGAGHGFNPQELKQEMEQIEQFLPPFAPMRLHAKKKPVPVIITAGQSNTDGRVSNDELPDYIKQRGYRHCLWSYGSDTLSGGGHFERYWPRVAKADNAARWGYDAVVYHLIDRQIKRDFYVIKESLGGTAIDTACTSTHGMYWSASPEFLASTPAADKGGKSLLKAFTENIDACIDNELSHLKEGYDIKAFLWHQGESDKKMANHYYDNLKAVVAYVRNYLVSKTGDQRYAHLPFICGTFSLQSRDRSQQVVDALHRLAAEDPDFHVVDMEDGTIQRDRLHFDSKGAELLGQRVYKRLIEVAGEIK